jgi:hypothetical protein
VILGAECESEGSEVQNTIKPQEKCLIMQSKVEKKLLDAAKRSNEAEEKEFLRLIDMAEGNCSSISAGMSDNTKDCLRQLTQSEEFIDFYPTKKLKI